MIRRSAILMLSALAASCATYTPVGETLWAERSAALLAMDSWEMQGKIAVQQADDGGQANMLWRQAGATSTIRLSGPLGSGAHELVWEPDSLSVTDAAGTQTVDYRGERAAEQFMQENLGWSFPAGSLRYWLMGLLNPAAEGLRYFDENGILQGLSQHGWEVSYSRLETFDGYLLPTKMELAYNDAKVRIVAKRWALGGSSL